MKNRKFCKKNQFFYYRSHTLNLIQEKGEFYFLKTCLQFGLLYRINGYARRHLQITKKEDFLKWVDNTLSSHGFGFEGNKLVHEYIEDLKFLLTLYED